MLLYALLAFSSIPASARSGGHWVVTVTQSGTTEADWTFLWKGQPYMFAISQSASVTAQSGDDEPNWPDVWIAHTLEASEVNVTLGAHSTPGTFGWDPTHPRFFSGTNCTANPSIGVDQFLISHAELDINGTPAKQYPDPNDPNATPNLSVAVDSTHFADDTTFTSRTFGPFAG